MKIIKPHIVCIINLFAFLLPQGVYSQIDNEVTPHSVNDLWIGAGFATGLDRSQTVFGLHQYLLTFGGFVDRSSWVQLNASYWRTPIHETIDPAYAIKSGMSILELGMEFRTYTPGRFEFFGHYFIGGGGIAFATWDYLGNLATSNLSARSSASIWGIDIHLGTGFFLGQAIPVTTNLDVTPGVIFWYYESYQGHYDTLMPTFYYLKIRFSFGYAVAKW